MLGKRSQGDSFAPTEMSGAVTVLPGVELPGVAAIMVAPAAPVVEVTPWGIDAPGPAATPAVISTVAFSPPTTAPLAFTAPVATLPAPHSAPLLALPMPTPTSAPLIPSMVPVEAKMSSSRSRLYVLLGAMLVAAGGAAYYALEILPTVGS